MESSRYKVTSLQNECSLLNSRFNRCLICCINMFPGILLFFYLDSVVWSLYSVGMPEGVRIYINHRTILPCDMFIPLKKKLSTYRMWTLVLSCPCLSCRCCRHIWQIAQWNRVIFKHISYISQVWSFQVFQHLQVLQRLTLLSIISCPMSTGRTLCFFQVPPLLIRPLRMRTVISQGLSLAHSGTVYPHFSSNTNWFHT